MRTTLNLHGDLLDYVRRRAAEERRTMTSVIEDALRRDLAAGAAVARRRPVKLPVCPGRGVRPGVNLDSTSELIDRMEGRL